MSHDAHLAEKILKQTVDLEKQEVPNKKVGLENKSSLMTTVTTLNKFEEKQLGNGVFYSQIFPRHTKKTSIASVNKFDQNFPSLEAEMENVSCIITDDNKDQGGVNVNVSNLDMDNSMIKGIERLETLFQLTNSNRQLIESTQDQAKDKEREQSELSIDDPNNKQKQKEKEKKKLINDEELSKTVVCRRKTVILIGVLLFFLVLMAMIAILYSLLA